MSLQTLEQFLGSFYDSHKSKLLESYPGLNVQRLSRDFTLYLQMNQVGSGADLKSIHLPRNNHIFESFFDSLLLGVPLEQILKRAYFYKSYFYVNKNVLIPRSETEILVEMATNFINKHKSENISLIDIGTGSGAIALSTLAEIENKRIRAWASDISEEALEVAQINYYRLFFKISKETELSFIKTDRLKNIFENFDVILSNPPYIKESFDFEKVHSQVHRHEPHLALYLKDEEYNKWFEEFFRAVDERLNEDGLFLMEGHEDHLNELSVLYKKIVSSYNEVKVLKDYTGRDRFLSVLKTKRTK